VLFPAPLPAKLAEGGPERKGMVHMYLHFSLLRDDRHTVTKPNPDFGIGDYFLFPLQIILSSLVSTENTEID
jgi:hypothetical protein